jgi:acetyl esterase/lipase
MRLAPPVQEFFNAPRESLDHLTVQQQRQRIRQLSDLNYHQFGRRPEPWCMAADHRVPVDGGEIIVRAYRPSTQARLPGHVELHGGGWWLGSIDEHVNEAICRYRCVHAGCVVFAVEYRLAPEHPFPSPLYDVYAALTWIASQAAELGVDPDRISIGGTSAGANLAAAATLLARDTGPALRFQLLEVPALDLTGDTMRAALATPELAPMADRIAEFETPLLHYLPRPADARSPLASPVHADDLSGLPPAHIMTAEYDPLREEGEWYGRRLADAGVTVTVTRHAGAVHGTSFLTRVWEPARQWQAEAAAALRRGHEHGADGQEDFFLMSPGR